MSNNCGLPIKKIPNTNIEIPRNKRNSKLQGKTLSPSTISKPPKCLSDEISIFFHLHSNLKSHFAL